MSYEHIDVGRLSGLTRELADDAFACLRFIDDFIAGWEQRQARVAVGVARAGIDDALAALLSLSTSSAMVGAESLSHAARSLYAESQQLGVVPALGVERLARIGRAVCDELRLAASGMQAA
jgi:hypothetical protein